MGELEHSPCLTVVYGPCSTFVTFEGYLDLSAEREVGAEVDLLLAFAPSRVVVDLERVEFIDSLGVALLLRLWRGIACHHGGTLVVTAMSPAVRRVLDLCGLARLFQEDAGTSVT